MRLIGSSNENQTNTSSASNKVSLVNERKSFVGAMAASEGQEDR